MYLGIYIYIYLVLGGYIYVYVFGNIYMAGYFLTACDIYIYMCEGSLVRFLSLLKIKTGVHVYRYFDVDVSLNLWNLTYLMESYIYIAA